MSTVYADLIAAYPTWDALSAFLRSPEGGSLRVVPGVRDFAPYALLRYVKGKSDLSIPHVRAFRSVLWDVLRNRPVSVTSAKSEDGEGLPSSETTEGYTVERFEDGSVLGVFYDTYSARWSIHTRTTPGAHCRYYSAKSFADLFREATAALNLDLLDRAVSYTCVLQHPENRIVTRYRQPWIVFVQQAAIDASGVVVLSTPSREAFPFRAHVPLRYEGGATWDSVRAKVVELDRPSDRASDRIEQGVVVKDAQGRRWKLRTTRYKAARKMRGNNARLDYLYLTYWKMGTLPLYLDVYPEERGATVALLERWKRVTRDVYHIHSDVFKARSLPRTAIPPKYRPFVYGLQGLYHELRETNQKIDWETTKKYMNERDVPQMLFCLNWEYRQASQQLGLRAIPFEEPVTHGSDVVPAESDVPASSESVPLASSEPPTQVAVN